MSERTHRRREWGAIALVTAAAVLPYLNALAAGFAFDDGPAIRDNSFVTGPFDGWGILAAPHYPGNLYRPLTLLTYALNEHLIPGSAAGFHAVNILLHLCVTLTVYFLGRVFCRSRMVGLIAAVLFAAHPIHTEAVTGIVGRAELLAALFGLLAILAALPDTAGTRPWWRGDAAALLAFTAALFSKESAITVLPLIVLCRAANRGGSLWPALWREVRNGYWIPFVLAAGLFLIARTYVVGSLTLPTRPIPLDNVLAHTPPDVRIGTALAIVADYVGLLLLPLVLSADYSWREVTPVASWWSLRVICGLGVLGGSLFACLWYSRRRSALAVLAVFPLVAVSLTFNILFPIGTVKAERLLYLPSVGCALFVAFIAWRERPPTRAAGVLLTLVVLAFSVRTWIRNNDWTDNLALFQATVEVAPRSAKAHHDLGVFLQRLNRTDEAAIHFRTALELYDDYDESAYAIGLIYEKKDLANGALAWYRKALAINPGHVEANKMLCGLLLRESDFLAAEAACRQGLRFAPANETLLKGLAASWLGQGDRPRALALFRRALAVNPADIELRETLAQLELVDLTPSG